MTFMFGFFEALELPSVLNGFEDRQSTLPKPILVDGVLSLVGHCLGLVVLWTDSSIWHFDVLLVWICTIKFNELVLDIVVCGISVTHLHLYSSLWLCNWALVFVLSMSFVIGKKKTTGRQKQQGKTARKMTINSDIRSFGRTFGHSGPGPVMTVCPNFNSG